MDYFLLKQDKRYSNTPQIKDLFKNINSRDLNLLRADNIEEDNCFYIKSNDNIDYLDVLDMPIFLVSKKLKKILEKYKEKTIFNRFVLIDFENKIQNIYYLSIFEEIEALSEKSEFNLNKTIVKKIVLDEKKIKNKKLFKIKESDKTLIVVRLDAAESLLRRDFNGIILEKLEIER